MVEVRGSTPRTPTIFHFAEPKAYGTVDVCDLPVFNFLLVPKRFWRTRCGFESEKQSGRTNRVVYWQATTGKTVARDVIH